MTSQSLSGPGSSRAAPEAAASVQVLIPLPLSGPYDYAAPGPIPRGSFLAVPLGPREVLGVAWGEGSGAISSVRLKEVGGLLDEPALPEEVCEFVDWVSRWTLAAPGNVLALALRSAPIGEEARTVTRLVATGAAPGRMTPKRALVLDVARERGPLEPGALAREAGVGSGVVRGLMAEGALEAVELPAEAPFALPDPDRVAPVLSPAQAEAADELRRAVAAREFAPFLLDGVTGSGKTEVYFEAVAAALRAGRQALVLLPEIALTVQFLERFAARFGCAPAAWHSDMTSQARRHVWRSVRSGEARVVVGARSALFLPFTELGLVVVDEEHDQAFKQEEGVVYHARDMAVVRARLANAPIVLASATPSLESLFNAQSGRYRRLVLPERHADAAMPALAAIDLKKDPPERGRFLSHVLLAAVEERLRRKEQTLLFLNRRGYAPLTICRACGHRMTAPHTSSWLVEHRHTGRLVCHVSGFSMPRPKTCPACGAPDSLVPCGPGVERIAEEVAERFPQARRLVMSSDLVANAREAAAIIAAMAAGEVDILIGTQMVAKGHHFPALTLVGVVDADLGLSGGDLRAAERTFQLLNQVAGRAGRAERPGEVLLQTYAPENPVIAALVSADRARFLRAEMAEREAAGMPPYGRLAALILSSARLDALEETGRLLARAAPAHEEIRVLGPAPAPFALLRGRHRHRFLVQAGRNAPLQAYIRDWLAAVKVPSSVRLAVDIDPASFL
ncbi:MAG: primosomal protein N' [Alphaproteobacteria bacterium]|nr:primosomal protein N' [Alphaproteobacteria bacterium]